MTHTTTPPLVAHACRPEHVAAALATVRRTSATLAKGGDAQGGIGEIELICPSLSARRRDDPDALNVSMRFGAPFPTRNTKTMSVNKTGRLVNRGATLITITHQNSLDGHGAFAKGSPAVEARERAVEFLAMAEAVLLASTDPEATRRAVETWNATSRIAIALSVHALAAHPDAKSIHTIAPSPTEHGRILMRRDNGSADETAVLAGPDEIDSFFAGIEPVCHLHAAPGMQTTGYHEEGDVGPIVMSIDPLSAAVGRDAKPMDLVRILRESGIPAPRLHDPVDHRLWNPKTGVAPAPGIGSR